tara:strand:- start:3150 stop:3980 length:831 start_codon:yes stop_codon:yes gene_type:complete
MPSQIRHPQWRESLEDTQYPFEPGCSLTSKTGATIPVDSFIDAHLYPIGADESMYLSKISVSSELVIFHIGDANSASVASGEIPVPGTEDNIRLVDSYGRPAGIIVSESEKLGLFRSLGAGDHDFARTAAPFVATVCMPTPQIGVRGISIPDGTLFTGPVWIVGEDGVVVTRETVTDAATCDTAAQTRDVIRVDVVGDPLFRRRLCVPRNLFTTPNFIQKIKIVNEDTEWTCAPDDNGYFTIQGNDSLAGDAALRVRITEDGRLEFLVEGSPNYNI